MTTTDERALIDYITSRRWFGAKTREVMHATLVDEAPLPTVEGDYAITLVEVRFEEGTHETYQLFRGAGEEDGLAEPAVSRELVHLMRARATLQAGDGALEFTAVPATSLGAELGDVRVVGAEQSNSSVIYDDQLILKAYRRIEAGINPELELLRFLTEREFENIAPLGGWYAYSGRPMNATLGVLQQFVAGGRDGWELALEELARDPDAFLARLHRLGQVTGSMHTVLGSDASDPSFCPEQPSAESLSLITATVDEEIEQAFLALPDDVDALMPIVGRGEDVREMLRVLTHVGVTGKIIRHHGDYHLGQTLWSDERDDWILLDFEGEPARPLPERRRKRSPLRDVAGMLRSFAYAASAAEITRGAAPPPDWERRAREHFLDGYYSTVDAALLPIGRDATEKLLALFELEKAVYELRYELNSRPEWVPIPVAGIVRMLEQPVGA